MQSSKTNALVLLAAILPSSTYERFVVLLQTDLLLDSLRSLIPLVTPSLASQNAQIVVKNCSPSTSSSTSSTTLQQDVIGLLQGAGYREARTDGADVGIITLLSSRCFS